MRLASGIAPIRAMRDAGVSVGIGVDGAASNDAGHMLAEVRMAMLLQRVASAHPQAAAGGSRPPAELTGRLRSGPAPGPRGDAAPIAMAMSAREALEIATLGGAKVLNRDDIGALAPGMAADIVTVALDQIGFTGAQHDPLAALLFCQVPRVRHSIVNGRVVVRDGELVTLDLPRIVERHNRLAAQLADAAWSTH